MKYELDQLVFYMDDNHVNSAKITSRCTVENVHDELGIHESTREWIPFGLAGIRYQTCHGTWNEDQLYVSKKELLEAL